MFEVMLRGWLFGLLARIPASERGESGGPYTTPIAFNPGAMTCGANPGSAVTPDYTTPFKFTGTIESVVVDVSGDLITDDEAEMRMHLVRQ